MTKTFIRRVLLLSLLVCVSAPAQTNLPNLRMTSSNGVSTVFWPLTAYFNILQTTPDLSPSATWTNLATGDEIVSLTTFPAMGGYVFYTTNIIGNEITFSLPATNRQQFFRLNTPLFIPACSFTIFYNGLLEFSQCPPWVINGRVHANGPIYVGTSALSLTFNSAVSTTMTLTAPKVDGLGSGQFDPWNTTFDASGYITNITSLGISGLNPTNYHFLIDIPPASEDPMSTNGQLRLYNEAGMILLVTNDSSGVGNPTVQLILQNSVNGTLPGADPAKVILTYSDASPALLTTNLPFLSLTNSFYDRREGKTNLVTQIDVGRFSIWVSTNPIVQSKLGPLGSVIFYVADRRNVSPKQLAAVRLINGAELPANNNLGFTVATMNPLYVQGNYNVQTASSSANASAGTFNTAYTVPAALISDALTILSANWTDANSFTTYSSLSSAYYAADTTVNAAIVTGTMPSTGITATTFSGGVHNLPRLLQNWTSKNLWLNTSIIRLWDSQMATNQFRNPDTFNPPPVNPYYNPPTRRFNFDLHFLNPAKIPPGIPVFD
jgi:hypothetical protein